MAAARPRWAGVCARSLSLCLIGAGPAAIPVSAAPPADTLRIVASAGSMCSGDTLTLKALLGDSAVPAAWSVDLEKAGTLSKPSDTVEVFHYVEPPRVIAASGAVTFTATKDGAKATKKIRLRGPCREPYAGDFTQVTIGYEQIGASGAKSSQKYSADFFIVRPIPLGQPDYFLGWPLRWFGDVGLASFPQQVSKDVASFARGFATSVGQLKVNELVQTATFTTGLELRLKGSDRPVRGLGGGGLERFDLMAYAGFGAVGPFPLDSDPQVFVVPAATSDQGKKFLEVYPGVSTPYVAFREAAPDRFPWHWTGGLRLYTYFAGQDGMPLATPPAIVSVGYGENRLVAPGDHVLHIAASYPLPLGDRTGSTTPILNLFGEAWLGKGSEGFSSPGYQLQPVASSASVSSTDANVTIVTSDLQARDTYRLGVSLDLIKVWQRLSGGASSAPDTTAAAAAPSTGGDR